MASLNQDEHDKLKQCTDCSKIKNRADFCIRKFSNKYLYFYIKNILFSVAI